MSDARERVLTQEATPSSTLTEQKALSFTIWKRVNPGYVPMPTPKSTYNAEHDFNPSHLPAIENTHFHKCDRHTEYVDARVRYALLTGSTANKTPAKLIESPQTMLDERSSMDELFDLVMSTGDIFVEPSVPDDVEADVIEPEPTEEHYTSTLLAEKNPEIIQTPLKIKSKRRRTLINQRVPSPEPVETKIESDTTPKPVRGRVSTSNSKCCVCHSTEKLGYTCFPKQLTYFLSIGSLKKTPKDSSMCKNCYNKWHHAVRRSSWGETKTTTMPKRTRTRVQPKVVPAATPKPVSQKRKRIKVEEQESEEESEEEVVIERQLTKEEAMKVRPKLKRGVSPEALTQYYWADELREECTRRGINTSGGTKKHYIARLLQHFEDPSYTGYHERKKKKKQRSVVQFGIKKKK